MNLVQLMQKPVPLWIAASERPAEWHLAANLHEVERMTATLGCQFRGVDLDRLSAVAQAGIDVDPTDSVIYVDDLTKAMEYGGMPKLILALDPRQLDRTFREIPACTPADEVASIRRRFPTVLRSGDGQTLWCSRLAETSPRLGGPYEVAYARWIPGEPQDALRAVLIFVGPECRSDVIAAIERAFSSEARQASINGLQPDVR